MEKPMIAKQDVKAGAQVLRAVNHQLRQKILFLLNQHGELSVTEIYVRLRVEQSVVSGHLRTLRRIGVVNRRREKKKMYYYPVASRIMQINDHASALANLL